MIRQGVKLHFIQAQDRLVDEHGRPTTYFLEFLNHVVGQSGGQGRDKLHDILLGQALLPGHIFNRQGIREGLTFTASDDGTGPIISISSHDLIAAGQTLSISGAVLSQESGTETPLALNTAYYVYYDDLHWRGGDVDWGVTQSPKAIVAAPGRWLLGTIITPAQVGDPETTGQTEAVWQTV